MVLVTSSGRPPTVSARPRDTPSGRRKRNKGDGPRHNAGAKRRTGNTTSDAGLVRAMFQRQATGRRGRRGGLGPRYILSARGEFKKRVRREFEGVPEMIVEVRKALTSDNTSALFIAVRAILAKLVEGNSAPFDLPPRPETSSASSSSARNGGHSNAHGHGGGGEGAAGGDVHHHGGGAAGHRHGDDDDDDPYHNGYPRVRRVDRDVFVALGGPELLIEVLRRPQWPADARHIPADVVSRDIPVWNITLYALRELCYTDQDLSERFGSSELILYLLTMMGHTGVFDNAVGLVEEILAVKSNTYFLGEVPDLHSLFDNMSSQQLAHFSRVLALLVFEPEYRQLMESAHVLRSMELLQLRRDRVVRADSVIDKNQALVLSAPNLLPRLMELLRVMNYNPPLAAFEEHPMDMPDDFAAQIRIGVVGSEIEAADRRGLQQQTVASEWAYLAELRAAAGADARTAGGAFSGSAVEASRQDSRRGGGNGGEPSRIVNFFRSLFRRNNSPRSDVEINSANGSRASGATGPLGGDASDSVAAAGAIGMGGDGVGVDGLATFAMRDLMNFLNPAFTAPNAAEGIVAIERTLASSVGGLVMTGSVGVGSGRVRSRRRLQQPSAAEAREELQLNGLLLAPHQVEVLFVLCTLLGARRKGEAHEALAKLGLIEVLDSMFDRLSWGVPSRQEGPHGAHCDCNPESALRVQYLRLVHNFLDRDSNNNPLKRLLLSTHERQLFASGRFMANPNGSGNVVFVKSDAPESDAPQSPFVWRGRAESGIPAESEAEKAKWVDTRGLLSKIVDVFMKEPMDSLYRFWLASCVEAFLRGGTTQEQLFIAGGGLLGHLVKEITSDGVWCTGSLQTAFDLLGELCKGNREVLEMLEASMTEKQLRRFLEVMVDNLVDSNVFMRSLVLSVEHSAFRRQTTVMSSGNDLGDNSGGGGGWKAVATRIPSDNDSAARGATVASSLDAPGVAKGVRSSVADGDRRGAFGSDTGGCSGEDDADEGDFYAEDGDGFQGLGAGEEPCYLGHTWFDVETQDVSLSLDSDTDEEEDWFSAKDTREEGCTGSEDGDSSLSSTAAPEAEEIESRVSGRASLTAAQCTEHDGFSDSDESGTTNSSGGGRALERRQQRRGTATGLAGTEEAKGGEENAIVSEVRGSERPGAAASGRRVMWGAGDGVAGFTRLQVFLKHNTPQLVRDLMGVVNLETINHENICCLNTAVLILIFADRRGQLAELVREVRRLPAGRKVPDVERDDDESKESENGTSDIDSGSLFGAYSRERRRRANQRQSRNAKDHGEAGAGIDGEDEEPTAPADGNTVLVGFRRLLWFWGEYYMRGGRDRLSLEFSTHVKFWAWKRVIRLLCADDGSPTALVAAPLRLPRSRYDKILPPPSTPV